MFLQRLPGRRRDILIITQEDEPMKNATPNRVCRLLSLVVLAGLAFPASAVSAGVIGGVATVRMEVS